MQSDIINESFSHCCKYITCIYTLQVHVFIIKFIQCILMYRQLIFLRKSDRLGCAVLLCLVVCLTFLASFFLPSHLSLKHVHVQCTCTCVRNVYVCGVCRLL